MDDIKRFRQFCELCKNIRGSTKYLIVGVDIAKEKHHAFFGTPNGQTLWRRLIFTLEPTSNYHKPLAHWLTTQGYLLVLVGGKAVKDNRELLDGRWNKNDTKDSANVADLIGEGKCLFYENPDDHILELRGLLSVRKQLRKETHRLRMRIRNGLLAKYFPEMDHLWGKCTRENLAIVRWYLDPRQISATSFDLFVRHVTTTDRGARQTNRLRKIHQAAQHSVGLPVDAAAIYEAQMLVDRFISANDDLEQIMAQIKTICQQLPAYKLLLTILGFGPYIAALVLSVLANPLRFQSHKQVIRLAGLDLNASRSGKTSLQSVPVISKKGNTELRYGLYLAAFIASYHDDGFRRINHRMIEKRHGERGIKTKARVKIAARMIVMAWSMLKNNEPFDRTRILAESV